MKICFSIGELSTGGIGVNFMNLAKELVDRGHVVDFFLLNKVPSSRDMMLPPNVKIFRGKGHARNSVFELSNYLQKTKPTKFPTFP